MLRKLHSLAALLLVAAAPTQALAFDFGFVRVPAYLDVPIIASAVVTAIAAFVLKRSLPAGRSYTDVSKEDRTTVMTVSACLSIASLVATFGLLFLGMGLQRAAEW